MKISNKFEIKLIDGHNVIVNCNDNTVCGTVDFNDIKMLLWRSVKVKSLTKSEMLDLILNEFDISTVLALGEIDNFIRKLKELGIIS